MHIIMGNLYYLLSLHIIMGNNAKRNITIHQKSICLDSDKMANYLVLVETVDNIPVATYLVKIPESYTFHNPSYFYYNVNQN